MDLSELLLCTAALDTDGVTQALVAVCHFGVEPKKTPQVDFTLGLDLQGFERNPADSALRHVPHRDAGIQRGDQMLLRIGKLVRATKFAGLRYIAIEALNSRMIYYDAARQVEL